MTRLFSPITLLVISMIPPGLALAIGGYTISEEVTAPKPQTISQSLSQAPPPLLPPFLPTTSVTDRELPSGVNITPTVLAPVISSTQFSFWHPTHMALQINESITAQIYAAVQEQDGHLYLYVDPEITLRKLPRGGSYPKLDRYELPDAGTPVGDRLREYLTPSWTRKAKK